MTAKKMLGTAMATMVTAGALVTGTAQAGAADGYTPLNPEMLTAMQRDLGLGHDEALGRLAAERDANTLRDALRGQLGEAFGGAYYDAHAGTLVAAVTDASKLSQIGRTSAKAALVSHTRQQLANTVDRLNATEPQAPASVTSWGADIKQNTVTLTAAPGTRDAAESYISQSGVDPSTVTVVEAAESARPFYDVQGGDAYHIGGQSRCSVGFSVQGGFVSAGHCAMAGSSLTGYNQEPMGSFVEDQFPGSDYSLAEVNADWTPRGVLNNGTRVAGSQEAAVGESVCKAGSTTGWTCGTIQAMDQTVRYPEGTVTGMTETDVRSDSGDSGGSVIAGNQAQGLLSGGDASTMYFQPINPALQATGATLVTG